MCVIKVTAHHVIEIKCCGGADQDLKTECKADILLSCQQIHSSPNTFGPKESDMKYKPGKFTPFPKASLLQAAVIGQVHRILFCLPPFQVVQATPGVLTPDHVGSTNKLATKSFFM